MISGKKKNNYIIAKNLLAARMCKNCLHHLRGYNETEYCMYSLTNDSPDTKTIQKNEMKLQPNERTCERWSKLKYDF